MSATIKLFLPFADAKRLRVGEVSNWTGKALAAPRTEIDALLARDELESAGVYFLLGVNPETGSPRAYVGEAEIIRDRLKQHKAKALDFWSSVVVFVSKDENLTKAHVRYLENRLWTLAKSAGRFELENVNASNPKLPESDREDMEVFLSRITQVMPVLGFDLLSPILGAREGAATEPDLYSKSKDARARGRRTESGFVVFKGSTALLELRPSALARHPHIVVQRDRLMHRGDLEEKDGLLLFMRDVEFSSPSSAASMVHGGGTNGLIAWRNKDGKTLKDLEST